ncbi:MAG: LytR C-terminal domain-containing protein [Microthrixaceae bacterium]|nr:LytR C-terminal domain-containing protein [Microthrixaceae bacterium]
MTSPRRPKQSGSSQDNRRTDAPPSEFLGLVLVAVAVALGIILLVKGGGIGFDNDSKNVAIGDKDKNVPTESSTTTTPAVSTSVPAAQLKVAVLNGAGKSGFAAAGANFLSLAGYPTVTAGNSATQVATSSVYFAPGYENDAAAVAKVLSIGEVKAIPATALGRSAADVPDGTAVVVVLGPDVDAIISASNTTTTAAGSSGTTTSTPATTAKSATTTTAAN